MNSLSLKLYSFTIFFLFQTAFFSVHSAVHLPESVGQKNEVTFSSFDKHACSLCDTLSRNVSTFVDVFFDNISLSGEYLLSSYDLSFFPSLNDHLPQARAPPTHA